MSAFCDGMLRALDVSERPLVIVFVTGARMRQLNRDYRGCDHATDVLSFDYPGEVVDGQPFLGEIVIAPEVASTQARNRRSGPEREIRKLLIHGILHLLGYDHEADDGEMKRIQRRMSRRQAFTRGAPIARM